jgi:hypothetical protein
MKPKVSNTMVTWSLFRDRLFQSTYYHHILLRCILILFSHLLLYSKRFQVPQAFLTKAPIQVTPPPQPDETHLVHLILLVLCPKQHFVTSTNHGVSRYAVFCSISFLTPSCAHAPSLRAKSDMKTVHNLHVWL